MGGLPHLAWSQAGGRGAPEAPGAGADPALGGSLRHVFDWTAGRGGRPTVTMGLQPVGLQSACKSKCFKPWEVSAGRTYHKLRAVGIDIFACQLLRGPCHFHPFPFKPEAEHRQIHLDDTQVPIGMCAEDGVRGCGESVKHLNLKLASMRTRQTCRL